MKLYTEPREIEVGRWIGSNREEIEKLCEGRGPTGGPGHRFLAEEGEGLVVWGGVVWMKVPLNWWVAHTWDGNLSKLSPDYVSRFCSTTMPSSMRPYYEAAQASKRRLERVALGVERLAAEVATVRGNLGLGRYIQDRLRQLLCTHPEGALKYGSAESWCSVCLSRLDPTDTELRNREIMAHVTTWCKCDTSQCPVHEDTNSELPSPRIVVPAIPEASRAPELRPAGELVQLGEVDDHLL